METFLYEHGALTQSEKPLCCFCSNQSEYDVHRNGVIKVCSFVRYFPEGRHDDNYVAFVQGILAQVVSIFIISRRETLAVKVEECALISPTEVTGGLVGLVAHLATFGTAKITDEERIDNLLWVKLGGPDGRTSDQVPITSINLCCSC
jgi:hypothetical protein